MRKIGHQGGRAERIVRRICKRRTAADPMLNDLDHGRVRGGTQLADDAMRPDYRSAAHTVKAILAAVATSGVGLLDARASHFRTSGSFLALMARSCIHAILA